MVKVNVFIVDDHEMFREGVKAMLNSSDSFNVIGEASDGEQSVANITDETDIVLMDISMPKMDGIEATQKLLKKNENLKIIALSMFGDEEYYYKMIHSGVKGFILKESGSNELMQALSQVKSGNNFFSQELLRNIIISLGDKKNALKENSKNQISFTKRELDVLHEICGGYSNKEIADRLHLGLRTIESYKSKIIKKTGVRNTIGLVMYAIKNKIIAIG